ncbi:MAG: histidinol-phosphatase [Oscillospiraceae bacterium]|jgi:histidinol-phosphatase (PHP family)|nr:histidinol-phosphatase [Oscillospiraceae bacterium]
MSFPQNLHTHTAFSDGKNTPEEMVLGALQAGCASLAFSDHSPMSPAADPDGWSMNPEKVPAYRAEIIRLREVYAGKLEIFLGLEQDIDSPPPAEEWDCLIGSVHGVWAGGCYLPVDESADAFDRAVREYFSGDCLAFARAYYRREAEAAGKTGCDIVGHFDLITKFNENGCRFDESDPRYRSAALEALEALMEKDVIFEINTGAISRGCRTTPYPAPFLLDAIRQKGGRVCITSDSHRADTIVHAFPQAAALAGSCGFREAWVLAKKGFQPVDLHAWNP